MRRPLAFALLALAFLACVDPQDPPPEPRTGTGHQEIVGGTIDTGDPAVPIVAIGNGGLCTGTVISPHVILTAGHCIGQNITIRFENEYGDGTGPVIAAVDTETEPQGADMGLIAMASAAPVTPLPYNTTPLESHINEPTRIVGFGVTSENGQDSGIKRQGMANLDGVAADEGGIIITSNDPQGTCYGDSGGPNFMNFGGGEVVVGVTTTGTDICGSGQDIGSRVDSFQSWIAGFVAMYDGEATCAGDGRCAAGCTSPDPDCPCEDDGFCTAACGDIASDPDCDGCEADGMCRQGCPVADPDCEGMPDAGPPTEGDDDDDGAVDGGCCSAGGETPASAVLLALCSLIVLRRRRV
jgi:hypothetical protein